MIGFKYFNFVRVICSFMFIGLISSTAQTSNIKIKIRENLETKKEDVKKEKEAVIVEENLKWPQLFNFAVAYLNDNIKDIDLYRQGDVIEKVDGKKKVLRWKNNNQIIMNKWENKPWYVSLEGVKGDMINANWILVEQMGNPDQVIGGVAIWNVGSGISFVSGMNSAFNDLNIHTITPALIALDEEKDWDTGGKIFVVKRNSDGIAMNDRTPGILGGFNPRELVDLPRESLEKASSGTGFFVSSDGYLVTAYHVIKGKDNIFVSVDGENFASARLIDNNRDKDVTVLKVDGSNFSKLGVLPSNDLNLGDAVSTLGYPNMSVQGKSQKYTRGHVNSLTGLRDNEWQLQVSVPIQPGNSGGPLINEDGNVVGIINSRLNDRSILQDTGALPQNVNYAVKSEILLDVLANNGINTETKNRSVKVEQLAPAVVMVIAF